MAGRSKASIKTRAARVRNYFNGSRQRVYQHSDLSKFLEEHRAEFDLPTRFSTGQLIQLLSSEGELQIVELEPEPTPAGRMYSGQATRYIWKHSSPYAVALSLKPGSYLTHASACFLHGLTDQIPHTIYINKEQSPKPAGDNLTQEAMDRAFANSPRVSNYVFRYGDYRIVVLSGKNTRRLEVTSIEADTREVIDVTKVERTLIDIAVRPTYGGGVHEVLNAFVSAKNRISIATLVATYKKLEYVYPYHQALGFYMSRAGYDRHDLDRIRRLGLHYDFYLTHKMREKKFDSDWRIFYPSSL